MVTEHNMLRVYLSEENKSDEVRWVENGTQVEAWVCAEVRRGTGDESEGGRWGKDGRER